MSNALVFWFTGLSGAGKSTIANCVQAHMLKKGQRVLILDGDDVRQRLHVHLGFTPKDIRQNNALITKLCASERTQYDIILVPIISPYRDSRKEARQMLSPGFFEVYFCATLDVVSVRDVKGIYAKARAHEIDNLIGFSPKSVYEAPENPDLALDSGKESVEESVGKFLNFISCQQGK